MKYTLAAGTTRIADTGNTAPGSVMLHVKNASSLSMLLKAVSSDPALTVSDAQLCYYTNQATGSVVGGATPITVDGRYLVTCTAGILYAVLSAGSCDLVTDVVMQ